MTNDGGQLYGPKRLAGKDGRELRNLFAMAEMDAKGENGYEPRYPGMTREQTVATAETSMRCIVAAAHTLALHEDLMIRTGLEPVDQ